eukprot:m.14001 g.14001  ORF g.14001 m.14001 type:complete len:708 (+) comp3109_c0_seq1:433-2556(+)
MSMTEQGEGCTFVATKTTHRRPRRDDDDDGEITAPTAPDAPIRSSAGIAILPPTAPARTGTSYSSSHASVHSIVETRTTSSQPRPSTGHATTDTGRTSMESTDSQRGLVCQYSPQFDEYDEICDSVDKVALRTRESEGFEPTDSFWLTYNGANLAAIMGIEWEGSNLGVPAAGVPPIRRALLTQPLFIHHLDVEGPFRRSGAAEDQVVRSVLKIFMDKPAGFLWYRLTGVLRARDLRHKMLAIRIINALLRVGRAGTLWRLGYHLARARKEARCLFGKKRSFMRVVTIALLRHRLEGVASKMTMILANDLIDMLRAKDTAGNAAADLLRKLIAQKPSCETLIVSGALLKLNYLCTTSRLASDITLQMKIKILSHNAELFHWMMFQINADERRSVVQPEDKKILILSSALLVTTHKDLKDLHNNSLGNLVADLMASKDLQDRMYGANILKALQSLWRKAKRGAVLSMQVLTQPKRTFTDALREGGNVAAAVSGLGINTVHIVQLREASAELLTHIEPLCTWEYLVELFKRKYPPIARVKGKDRRADAGDGGSEAALDIVLTRGRAEIAATMFAEVRSALASGISSNTQLSQFALDNIELLFFACKAIPDAAFEALKHYLAIAVPKRSLSRMLEALGSADLEHPVDDLQTVWLEEVLASIEDIATNESIPLVVAKDVYTTAYNGAIYGIANARDSRSAKMGNRQSKTQS